MRKKKCLLKSMSIVLTICIYISAMSIQAKEVPTSTENEVTEQAVVENEMTKTDSVETEVPEQDDLETEIPQSDVTDMEMLEADSIEEVEKSNSMEEESNDIKFVVAEPYTLGEKRGGVTIKSIAFDKSEVEASGKLNLEICMESDTEQIKDFSVDFAIPTSKRYTEYARTHLGVPIGYATSHIYSSKLEEQNTNNGKREYIFKAKVCTCDCDAGDIVIDCLDVSTESDVMALDVSYLGALARITTDDPWNMEKDTVTIDRVELGKHLVDGTEEIPIKACVTCSEAVKQKNTSIFVLYEKKYEFFSAPSYTDILHDENKDGVYEGVLKPIFPAGNSTVMKLTLKKCYLSTDCGKVLAVYENKEDDLAALTLNEKLGDIRKFVSRMYTEVLNREAEAGGLEYWCLELSNQKQDGAALANGFINSEEFRNRNINDSDYLDILYATFFGRKADSDGKNYWLSEMRNGMSRNTVLAGFVNSKEFGAICESYGIARGTMENDGSSIYNAGVHDFVLRNYTKALGRDGEVEGVEYWSHLINTKQKSALDCAMDFFHSKEFMNKNLNDADYVEVLYETYFGRASDVSGKNYWLSMLAGGNSRDWVLSEFAHSPEFKNIMAQYGL